jgi:hypothetical protein
VSHLRLDDIEAQAPGGHGRESAQRGATPDTSPSEVAAGHSDAPRASSDAAGRGAHVEQRNGAPSDGRAASSAAGSAPTPSATARAQGPLADAVVNAGGDAPQRAAVRARSADADPPGTPGAITGAAQHGGDHDAVAHADISGHSAGAHKDVPHTHTPADAHTAGPRGTAPSATAHPGEAHLGDAHPGTDHDAGAADAQVPEHSAPPRSAAASSSGRVGFAESDVERLVPVQPGEQREMRAQRLADARQQLAQDRAYAAGRLTEFTSAQRQRIAALQQARPQIDQALDGSERQAAGQVAQAAAAQSAAIRAGVASALVQAQSAATAARAQIAASYAATTQAIEAATRSARGQVETSYQQAAATTRASEARQMGEVGRLYTQAEGAFHAAASAAGAHAISVASQRAAEYRSHKINEDDSFLDGPLTDNRCDAQADAAEKVGQAYRDELTKEGDKQVAQMRQRRPTDGAAVHQVADEARRNLDTAHTESLRALDQGRQRAMDSARQVRDGALTGTTKTLAQTQMSLRDHERAQLAAVRQQAATQRQALRQQRTAAAAQLHKGIDQAVNDLGAGLDRSLVELHKAEVPERAALDHTLAHAGGAIEAQLAQLHAGLDRSREQVTQALTNGGASGAQSTGQAGTAAVAAAHHTGSGAAQALAQGAQSAGAALQQITATHQQSTTACVTAATTGNDGITKGVDQAYAQLGQNLLQGMQHNADAVRTGLTDAVDHDMGATITSEAQKAYDQVKPRWQSVLKWVIIIAIVLVVAIVLGPMVIGAVAGLAAGLGASAAVAGVVGAVVGGAIVGAGTAAVTTVVDNAFAGRTGWDLFQGVGTAMAWGALGGALGGGASALLAGPMQGMTALARYGVQVGVDSVLNTGLSLAQGNFTWENFGTGLLMSMLVNGVTASPRVRGISEGAMSRGYGAGFEGGIGIRNRLPGAATPPGPTSIPAANLEHVARGDTAGPNSPNAGNWNVKGGGHIPGEIIPRADAEGVPHSTTTSDPVNGVSIENFTRPSGANTPKSLFPPGTTRAQVEIMGTEGLNRALTNAPGSTIVPPTAPNTNGSFTATVMGPHGQPIVIKGYYRPNAIGGFEIRSVFPSTDIGTGTVQVPGGTGLGGSRNVPPPIYIHPLPSNDDRDKP